MRKWLEQPLSLLSKLAVAALLGILGAFVILGIKELGAQLDKRLNDREALTSVIAESYDKDGAISRMGIGLNEENPWQSLGGRATTFFLANGIAEFRNFGKMPIIGVVDTEALGLVDDFFLVSETLPAGRRFEFSVGDYSSEAGVIRPSPETRIALRRRNALLGSVARLGLLFSKGFTETTVYRADSVKSLRKADSIVKALAAVEQRRIFMQSNLVILEELEKIQRIQAQAMVWVTIGSALILGLVFGSLAWMEFKEEQYLLALLRTFGVGGLSLVAHSLVENCLLAVGGVLLGFLILGGVTSAMNLEALDVSWLAGHGSLLQGDNLTLLAGAALGGLLSVVPIAIGLRKPLGLVLT